MKKHILFLASCALIIASSCNYISDPMQQVGPVNDGSACPNQSFPTYNSTRIVLLEDYTGQNCPNCPKAAIEIDTLKEKFPGKVVYVAVHAGDFAKPKKAPFTTDYRTDAGDIYNGTQYFNIPGYPRGLINRKDYPTNHAKVPDKWQSEISTLLDKPPVADLQLMSEFDSKTGKVCIFVKYKLSANLTSTYGLTLWLTQDNIVSPQNVNGTIVDKYTFNHMLRTSFTDPWGVSVDAGTGQSTEVKYQYTIASDYRKIECVPKDCHIVGFIYDKSNYEVLQAAEVKVTN